MKNLKAQTKSGQCGVYNLANMLQDEDVLRLYSEDPDYIPCGNFEINKILKGEGYPFTVEPLISAVTWEQRVPYEFVRSMIESLCKALDDQQSEDILPFILVVQKGEGAKGLHATTILYHKGRFAFSDPSEGRFTKEEGLAHIVGKYGYVNALHAFTDEKGDFLSFRKEFYEDCNLEEIFQL